MSILSIHIMLDVILWGISWASLKLLIEFLVRQITEAPPPMGDPGIEVYWPCAPTPMGDPGVEVN